MPKYDIEPFGGTQDRFRGFSGLGVVGLAVPKYDIEPFDGAQDRFRGFNGLGVVGLAVPKYDIEPFDGAQDKCRGFTESGVVNSVNPFNSLSYPPHKPPSSTKQGDRLTWTEKESVNPADPCSNLRPR